MPGLLRAGRRLRPRQRRDQGRAATATSGSINGQKVWTSLAHLADWCFVRRPHRARARSGTTGCPTCSSRWTRPASRSGRSSSSTGTSEFNEVFFDGARTDADLVVGEPGDGWRVAMGTLGFERGVSTLGQQVGFQRELDGSSSWRGATASSTTR